MPEKNLPQVSAIIGQNLAQASSMLGAMDGSDELMKKLLPDKKWDAIKGKWNISDFSMVSNIPPSLGRDLSVLTHIANMTRDKALGEWIIEQYANLMSKDGWKGDQIAAASRNQMPPMAGGGELQI
jgi:hypothetical protein